MVLCGVILSLMKLTVLVRFGLDVTTRDSVFVGNVVSVCTFLLLSGVFLWFGFIKEVET